MFKRLKKFAGLVQGPSEFWLFLRIGAWILLITILLRLASLQNLMRIITPSSPAPKKYPRDKIVNFISFWLGREKLFLQRGCLKRSLVLYRYLRLQSEPVCFCLGIRKENEELRGHAWLTLDRQPVLPEDDLNYRLIFTYPGETPGQG